MEKEELRIVFMGTPEFAVESLRALVEGGYKVVGVVTMPDKPMGRHGSVLQSSPVKQYAQSVGLPVLQPEKLKDETFLSELRALKADLQIVVAFRMLPEVVWNMPPKGTFNLHGSLLPQYRGAAPINWAIINGEKETGVTTFFLTHEIDTGKIIRQRTIPISEEDNAGTIHDALMVVGAGLVTETVDLILANKVMTIDQGFLYDNQTPLHSAPKIFKETCKIDWNKSFTEVYNFIRGLSPYPGAWTELVGPDGKRTVLKIFEVEIIYNIHFNDGGMLYASSEYGELDVTVPGCYIRLKSIQLAGKKRMSVKDFLNGFKEIEKYRIAGYNE